MNPAESGPRAELKSFQQTMDELPNAVPSEALSNVSVPFCFICLLHLANEHNLSLEATTDGLGDFRVRQNLK